MTKKQIRKKLSEVEDPELGIDIVSLGFIYEIDLKNDQIKIKMSLTTPGCPLKQLIFSQIKHKLAEFVDDPKKQIQIELVFDPPWTPELMSAQAKEKLGWTE